jgi:hypothetical protein
VNHTDNGNGDLHDRHNLMSFCYLSASHALSIN